MATPSNATKSKVDNNNLTKAKSLGKKPKQPSSVSSEDGSDQKPEKPLPNYLKPTISSRPDPVKFLKKNDQDNQKLLRRRSFDRPPSSLPSASTPSPRIQKTLNASPSLPRDKPAVPREKPATAQRSSSFHGSRSTVPRGGNSVKSPHVAPKKSGLSSSSSVSLKSKREGSEHIAEKKAPEKEIALDTASLSSAQEDEEEILKAESDVQVSEDVEEPKDEKENEEVHVEVVHVDTSGEENEIGGSTLIASVVEDIVVVKENEKEEEEEEEEESLINEHISEEKIEENKEQENKVELTEEVTPNIDEDETSEKVDADLNTKEVEKVEEIEKVEEVESVEETREVKEEVKEEKEVNREEKKEVKDEEKDKVKEESGEGKKKEVVKGKKESPSAYNDVIASKMQENPRKNKVLALAGAFQTVIDYETAASK